MGDIKYNPHLKYTVCDSEGAKIQKIAKKMADLAIFILTGGGGGQVREEPPTGGGGMPHAPLDAATGKEETTTMKVTICF